MKTTITLLTLFPEALQPILNSSILRRAQSKGVLELETLDLRQFARDKHKSVDDRPFGGSQGMLLRADVLEAALESELQKVGGKRDQLRVFYPSPRGLLLSQGLVQGLSNWMRLEPHSEPRRVVIIAGRYEGIDERIINRWVDLEFSIGDFIVTGGEIPALALLDALVRLMPDVLGDEKSHERDSFSLGLLEEPQYTRPQKLLDAAVPEVLLSGNDRLKEEFRIRESLLLTYAYRPDLIDRFHGADLPDWGRELLERLQRRRDLRF